MKEFVLPSINQRGIGWIGMVFRTCFRTKVDPIKQSVELESTKDLNIISGTDGVDKLITRDVDKERAEALIFTVICAQPKSTQPLECAEAEGLLTIFFSSEARALASAFGSGAFPSDTFAALAGVDHGHSLTRCPA
jgi:hypothetical protein